MKRCKGDDYKDMKELLYKKFLRLDNIKNLIDLIDSLDKYDKKAFLQELMKKYKFSKEQYYSKNENRIINLLCELNEKGKLKIYEKTIIMLILKIKLVI